MATSSMKRLRQTMEVWLTRFGLLVIPRLPRRIVVWLARTSGRIAYYLDGHGRRVGQANLDIAYGETKSPSEKNAILRAAFQSFALTLFDVLWFTRDSVNRLKRYVHFDDNAWQALSQHEPQLLVTGHLGNWETIGQAVAAHGFPIHSVAAPLRNPRVESLFTPSRQLTGQKIVHKEGALRTMMTVLSRDEKVAILLDQNTKPGDGGVFVPFFGLPVPVSTAPAAVAMRTGANLIFGYGVPQPDGTYRVVVLDTMVVDKVDKKSEQDAVDDLTTTILGKAEEAARQYPEYWMWMYKRWKYVAPGYERSDFPWYAKSFTAHYDMQKTRMADT